MITCPYCAMKNEEGTLFCERCKSDLASATPTSPPFQGSENGGMSEPVPANGEIIPAAETSPADDPALSGPATDVPMAEPVIADTAQHAMMSASTVEHKPVEQAGPAVADGAAPKLIVIRGQRTGMEYPIYPGENYLGRTDEKPVDIDLEDQEAPDRVWCSRQHAKIVCDQAGLIIEDLGSQNGTFVNRARIYPGQTRPLADGDVVQIGTVQLRVKA
jgi:hypothetical protein